MPYASLRDFIARLETAGRLWRVAAPVSPFLEMTEIQTRLLAEGGPAVLFENVVHDRAAMQCWSICSAPSRVARGIDREPRQLREIGRPRLLSSRSRRAAGAKHWKCCHCLRPSWRCGRARLSGARQEIVLRGPRSICLPVQMLAGEPAPLITWPLVVTKGRQARGRVQPRHLPHAGHRARHDADALARHAAGRASPAGAPPSAKPPAAVVIGADLHDHRGRDAGARHLSEYQFAGLLRGGRLTSSVQDRAAAGARPRPRSSSKATCARRIRRRKPLRRPHRLLLPWRSGCISGAMRQNLYPRPCGARRALGSWRGLTRSLPLLQQQFPEIVDFWLPPEGCSHRIAVVSIRKTYPGQAKRVMMGIWSFLRQHVHKKFVIVG
jgi:4-hydroxy-3-polyprenylbenzoate decarboxylase